MVKRAKAPTPKLFRQIRNVGLSLAAVSTVLLASPLILPALLVKIAGYMAVAGAAASAVSQVTTTADEQTADEPAV